jgi:hypothetical protein
MSQEFNEMKEFIYRRPRYRVDVPVIVHLTPLYSTCGRCTDVSAEGLGVRLAEPAPVGDIVMVEFLLRGHPVRAKARVEYSRDGIYHGLRFELSSLQERDCVKEMIGSLQTIT